MKRRCSTRSSCSIEGKSTGMSKSAAQLATARSSLTEVHLWICAIKESMASIRNIKKQTKVIWTNQKKTQHNFSIWTKQAQSSIICLYPEARFFQVFPEKRQQSSINNRAATKFVPDDTQNRSWTSQTMVQELIPVKRGTSEITP
jgi:hypothetical protein